jgi:hypothetical protein
MASYISLIANPTPRAGINISGATTAPTSYIIPTDSAATAVPSATSANATISPLSPANTAPSSADANIDVDYYAEDAS